MKGSIKGLTEERITESVMNIELLNVNWNLMVEFVEPSLLD